VAGFAEVVVTNPDGQSGTSSDRFTYTLPPPTVTDVSSNSGPSAGGTIVAVIGSDFVDTPTVMFGDNAGNVLFVASDSITVETPAGSGTVDVIVTNPDGGIGTLAGGLYIHWSSYYCICYSSNRPYCWRDYSCGYWQ